MKKIRVAVVQTNPRMGRAQENVGRCVALAQKERADVFVFPELATTGYNFSSADQVGKLAEPAGRGPAHEAFSRLAAEKKAYICYGFAERAKEGIYNSASLLGPGGLVGTYRKTHLFDREKLFFRPGDSGFGVYDLPCGRVGIMICFDWLFPEAMRTLALKGAQLVLHPANLVLPFCPDGLKIRCLENRVYAAAADRVGSEEGGEKTLTYIGQSEVVSPRGEILVRLEKDQEGVGIAECDLSLAESKALNSRNDLFKDRRPEFYAGDK